MVIQPITYAFAFSNPAPVGLGTAGTFTVLAGSTVTNTGATVISADKDVGGNLGVSPGSAVTGFPPGVVTPPGTIHAADATAGTAQTDAGTAYNDATSRSPDIVFPPVHDLVGQTLTAGVYNDPSSLALSGTVTLDGEGNPDAVFIFQAGSTLITASSSSVVLINGAQACHVFWVVGSSATLGTHVVVMPQVVVTHDCRVDDFATLCAGVVLGGSVTVGRAAYLGMGSSVRERVAIGPRATLGMGAACTGSNARCSGKSPTYIFPGQSPCAHRQRRLPFSPGQSLP